MEIKEKFFTINSDDLQVLCRSCALRFQRGYDKNEFIVHFYEKISDLIRAKRMSELDFNQTISSFPKEEI